MSSIGDERSSHKRLAELRFSVVGPLFAAPPEKGKLREALLNLSAKNWLNPVTDKWGLFGFSTIERWYYQVKKEQLDPMKVLTQNVRRDFGKSHALSNEMIEWLEQNYLRHPSWSYRLHVDNLYAWIKLKPDQGRAPSYSAVVRFMGRKGYYKKPRARSPKSPAFKRAQEHRDLVEVRNWRLARPSHPHQSMLRQRSPIFAKDAPISPSLKRLTCSPSFAPRTLGSLHLND